MESIEVTRFDEINEKVLVDTILFTYNKKYELIKYEGIEFIETYLYDQQGNLIEINKRLKEGLGGCGNTIHKWTGKYDSNHNLIEAFTYSMMNTTHYLYSFNETETVQTVEIIDDGGMYNVSRTKKKYFENGLLVKIENFNSKGELKRTDMVTYEFEN
ncbi:MAG: hypothetical protein ABJG68_16790 [Crocinitomicaceae bacterium]